MEKSFHIGFSKVFFFLVFNQIYMYAAKIKEKKNQVYFLWVQKNLLPFNSGFLLVYIEK